MSDKSDLNERGNHQGQFTQGVGGWAEYTVNMTEIEDAVRHDVTVPPGKVIPIIFLPGVMGSNLRMSAQRQKDLKREDSRAWRPDDLLSNMGQTHVVTGTDLGGWLKNASPAQRQLNFDPNQTEVEYYHYTENKERFDPEGKETLGSDLRHGNVPSDLRPIPPLLGQALDIKSALKNIAAKKTMASAAQIARWRGWSEVLFIGPYAEMLKVTEAFMNNIVNGNRLLPRWQTLPTDENGKPMLAVADRSLSFLLRKDPACFGAVNQTPLTDNEIKAIGGCWYPVHALGYNFLKSNGECAKVVASRIRGLVQGYRERGFDCKEVIIVTHSMGGLLGRALLHPQYGNLLLDKNVKILGMYHSVMPVTGAAATYKRMRFGFQEGNGPLSEMKSRLFGVNGENATAILANAPGPLELLPSNFYGKEWLKLVDPSGRVLMSWPDKKSTSIAEIYLQPESAWWHLIKPKWTNPGKVLEKDGGGIANVYKRIRNADSFTQSIGATFHPDACYGSFCESQRYLSYGDVVFKVDYKSSVGVDFSKLPAPDMWSLVEDDGKGMLKVQAGGRILILELQLPTAMGDETVPAKRSASFLPGTRFLHEKENGEYEHQNSFSDPYVLASMLYSFVKIAAQANWGKK